MMENSSIFESAQWNANASKSSSEEAFSTVKTTIIAKGEGLVTMSGLPPSHWKTLFHLELVRERNKAKEAPKKPPSAPFFLQWRGGTDNSSAAAMSEEKEDGNNPNNNNNAEESKQKEEDGWDAVWSDDDDEEEVDGDGDGEEVEMKEMTDEKNSNNKDIHDNSKRMMETSSAFHETSIMNTGGSKKRKVSHLRSHLAGLLEQCHSSSSSSSSSFTWEANDSTSNKHTSVFGPVTQYMATMGPSAIDVALSTLCHGMHDLEEGLPLLHVTSLWLLEACQSRQNFEAINAYLNRFLSIHSSVIAGIEDDTQKQNNNIVGDNTKEEEEDLSTLEQDREEKLKLLETVRKLRLAQAEASDSLRGKMQHTLCLLKHFSRMV